MGLMIVMKTEDRKVKRSADPEVYWEGKVTYPEVDVENSTDENLYILIPGLASKVNQDIKRQLDAADAANVSVREAIETCKKFGVYEAALLANPNAFAMVPLPTELTVTIETCRQKPAPRGRQKAVETPTAPAESTEAE